MTIEAVGSGEVAQLHNSTIPDNEPEKDDLRGDILAAIEKLKGGESETVADESREEVSSSSASRARDPATGQFVKTEGADPAATAQPNTDPDPIQDTQAQPSQAIPAPKGWSADAKAKWAALDPSIQAEVMRRETDMDNGGRQWSEEKQTYQQQLAPLGEFAQRYGIDNGTALTRLLDWQRALEANPREALIQLAQLSGIDLSNPNQPQQQSQPVLRDPRLDAVLPTVQQLEARYIQSQIDAFKTSPGHEHFDAVSVKMGELMAAYPQKYPETPQGMQAAYDDAMWLNPEIRESLINARVTPAQQQQAQQAQVSKAKAAAQPKGSGPTGSPLPKALDTSKMSDRDIVLAAAREHGWAV